MNFQNKKKNLYHQKLLFLNFIYYKKKSYQDYLFIQFNLTIISFILQNNFNLKFNISHYLCKKNYLNYLLNMKIKVFMHIIIK